MEGGHYLEELKGYDHLYEMLSERFDNALEMMTLDAIIYGGATRDCIAGKEALGDLDISVSQHSFRGIYDSFLKNPRWAEIEGPVRRGKKTLDIPLFGKNAEEDNPYEAMARSARPVLNGVTNFAGVSGQVVQIMTPSRSTKDLLADALILARTVDIRCCGIIMLSDGRIFEVVPGAAEDCLEGVLRLNPESGHIEARSTTQRIKKLTARGWKSEISRADLKRHSRRSRGRREDLVAKDIRNPGRGGLRYNGWKV